jgi:hypothetical protein
VKEKYKNVECKEALSGKENIFATMNAVKEEATKFIVRIAGEITPAAGKSFTEGEFVSTCLLIAACELLCW